MTPQQLQILRDMAMNPQGENSCAVPYEEIQPLQSQQLVRFTRVTRYARIAIYRITDKGRRALRGAESQ